MKIYKLNKVQVVEMVENDFAAMIYEAITTYKVRFYFDLGIYLIKYENYLKYIQANGWGFKGVSELDENELNNKIDSELKAIENLKQLRRKINYRI